MEPAVFAAWLSSQVGRVDHLAIEALPPDNEIIPTMCAAFGITRLVHRLPGLPPVFRWRNAAGQELLVHDEANAGAAEAASAVPVHLGPLPATATKIRSFRKHYRQLVHLVRLQDALAVLDDGRSGGNEWGTLVDMLDGRTRPVAPAPASQGQRFDPGCEAITVWNPLPVQRAGLLRLAVEDAEVPWALHDPDGRAHPVQLVEGATGRELLCGLALGPLACVTLAVGDQPVAGGHWEVSPQVLDNGITRVEFGQDGHARRISIDGWFPGIGPDFLQPRVDASADWSCESVTVLEDGPVRARLVATHACTAGRLRLTWSLQAGDPSLHLQATWLGEATEACRLPLRLAAERTKMRWWPYWGEERRCDLRPDLFDEGDRRLLHGVDRCLLDGTGQGPSLGVAAIEHRQLDCHPATACVAIPVESHVSWRLTACRDADDLTHLSLASLSGIRSTRSGRPSPPPFRLYDDDGLEALWIRCDGAGAIQLLLAETADHSGVASLVLPGEAQPQVLVDGAFVDLEPHREERTWRVPYRRGEFLLLSW